MANEYVEGLQSLLDRVAPVTPRGKAIAVKPFFGGAAGYVDGHIWISMTKVGLALKLPAEDRLQLFETGEAGELQYFPRAPVKKQYALLSDDVADNDERVGELMGKSIAFVLSVDT